MTLATQITLTPFERQHLGAVDDLIFNSYLLHTHMDWYAPLEWLEQPESTARLAWQGQRLVGILAASPPFNGAAWLRLAALHDRVSSRQVFATLWHDLAGALLAMNTEQVHVLIARPWIKPHLANLGFQFIEDVITLQRNGSYVPAAKSPDIVVRPTQPADLAAVAEIDHAAFSPPWQMTSDELRKAHHIAAICTAATQNQQVVGYQISTLYSDEAHLARLAVAPAQQGRGIGALLLDDLLQRFSRRHITALTVNTQIGNLRSQHLYRRFGFYRNGYDLPVWALTLRP